MMPMAARPTNAAISVDGSGAGDSMLTI